MLEVADVVRAAGAEVCARLAALPSQQQALRSILQCRASALGGDLYRCDNCGVLHFSYHSCGNRHCPKCHGQQTRQWLEQQRARLLPCPYYLLTFTLPAELRESQAAELESRKKERELDRRVNEAELEIARKLESERAKIRKEAADAAVESERLKLQEKEGLISNLQQQIDGIAAREEKVAKQAQALSESQRGLDRQIAEKLTVERQKLVNQAQERARQDLAVQMQDLCNQLGERDKQLRESQAAELESRKKERELDRRVNEAELEIARKQAAEAAVEGERQKLAEKEKVISDLQSKITLAAINGIGCIITGIIIFGLAATAKKDGSVLIWFCVGMAIALR